jgi:hypothetical protein
MTVSKFAIRFAAALALTGAASAGHAAYTFATIASGVNVLTTAQTYRTSVSGALDTLSDLTINTDLGTTSLNRPAVFPGPVSYTVSTETNLWTVQSPVIGGPALSVDGNFDTLTFSNFGGVDPTTGIRNFGASFYMSESNASNASGGSMKVTATDTAGLIQTFTFTQGTSGGAASLYFTLASTVALQSVQLIGANALGSTNTTFATVDNVVLAPVPVPASSLLMLSGLGALALRMVKRRKA